MKKETKRNLLHKWHWFWWSIHLRWLVKDYEEQVKKCMYDAITEALVQPFEPIAEVKFDPEEFADSLIAAGCCKWGYFVDNNKNCIKVINDNAGKKEVQVDPIVIDFLLECKEYYYITNGKVNIAMGSILSLWHDARTEGINNPFEAKLPDIEKLIEVKEHISFDSIVINEELSTVYISDSMCKLDVGAIAKGWSVQKVCEELEEGFLLSVGGNVCATGPKTEKNTPWVVGIQKHNSNTEYLHTLNIKKGSVVTSGDYQRRYTVEGKQYHHIIDPVTLYPANYWHSVTIICDDSKVADMLSTALFLLPLEEGKAILKQFSAEAVWVDLDDQVFYSSGFYKFIKK
jgi:thiamine biosynthesis lipoprotein